MMDYREVEKDVKKYLREQEAKRKALIEKQNQGANQHLETKQGQHYDKPGTMETATAIILYIIVMIIGTVFTERIYIYAGATMTLICFLCRHKFKHKNKK